MLSKNDPQLSDQQFRDTFDGNISEYYRVVVKHRKLIGKITVAAFIVSVIVSLLLDKTYIATARLLPPRDQSPGFASLLSAADDPLSNLASTISGNKTPAALYVGILKSRSVAEGIIKKFNLKEHYDTQYAEDVYSILKERTTIDISKKDQLITVSVIEKNPQFAADLANAYVEMLDRINQKLNITQGKRKRLFLEERLKEVRTALDKAETDLKGFKEKYNIVSIEEQAKVSIEGAAEIKGEIIAAQTELEVFKQFGTERQIEAVMLKTKIEELQEQLDAMKRGRLAKTHRSDAPPGNRPSNLYIPFDDLPDLGMQLMRLTREAKIQEKLFELLIGQYEMARIEESKNINMIQVLDAAVPPEKKAGPRRRTIVLSSVMVAMLAAVLLAFFLENIDRFRRQQVDS